MAQKVLVIDRSPLARNIYYMILKKLGDIDLVSVESSEAISEINELVKGANLVVVSESTVSDRKDELLNVLKDVQKETRVPFIIFVNAQTKSKWEDFSELSDVEILERPFYPDNFLNVVEKTLERK